MVHYLVTNRSTVPVQGYVVGRIGNSALKLQDTQKTIKGTAPTNFVRLGPNEQRADVLWAPAAPAGAWELRLELREHYLPSAATEVGSGQPAAADPRHDMRRSVLPSAATERASPKTAETAAQGEEPIAFRQQTLVAGTVLEQAPILFSMLNMVVQTDPKSGQLSRIDSTDFHGTKRSLVFGGGSDSSFMYPDGLGSTPLGGFTRDRNVWVRTGAVYTETRHVEGTAPVRNAFGFTTEIYFRGSLTTAQEWDEDDARVEFLKVTAIGFQDLLEQDANAARRASVYAMRWTPYMSQVDIEQTYTDKQHPQPVTIGKGKATIAPGDAPSKAGYVGDDLALEKVFPSEMRALGHFDIAFQANPTLFAGWFSPPSGSKPASGAKKELFPPAVRLTVTGGLWVLAAIACKGLAVPSPLTVGGCAVGVLAAVGVPLAMDLANTAVNYGTHNSINDKTPSPTPTIDPSVQMPSGNSGQSGGSPPPWLTCSSSLTCPPGFMCVGGICVYIGTPDGNVDIDQ